MSDRPPDAVGLRRLLATILAGAIGESETAWSKRIGAVELLPIVLNPRCNWSVSPSGTPEQRSAIEKAIELVRAEHPYIRGKPVGS